MNGCHPIHIGKRRIYGGETEIQMEGVDCTLPILTYPYPMYITSPAYVTMVTLRIKSVPPPLSFSFSMCSGFPWKADHMRGVIIELSLKFA